MVWGLGYTRRMQTGPEAGSEGLGFRALRFLPRRNWGAALRGSSAWAVRALVGSTLLASVLSASCEGGENGSSGSGGGGDGGGAGNLGQSGSSGTGHVSGGSGASGIGGSRGEEGGENGWSGSGNLGGGFGVAGESGLVAGGAAGAAPWSEGWDFCTAEASDPVGSADLTVSLSDRVWCTRAYAPSNEDLESGEDLLAKSLRMAVQARPVSGEYTASSDSTELELPWCVRSRTAAGTSSALGTLEVWADHSGHDQPLNLGSESIMIRATLGAPTDESVIRGPGSALVFFDYSVVEMGHCDEPAGNVRVVRSFDFAEGSVSLETRRVSDSNWETMRETWVKAWGEFAGEPFEVGDSLNLAAVEMPGSRNILELGVVLDTPIGDVCGFRVDFGGLSERFFVTECDLTVLRELEITGSDVISEAL